MLAEDAFTRLTDDGAVTEPTVQPATLGDTPPPPPPMPEAGAPVTPPEVPTPPPAMPTPADPAQPADPPADQEKPADKEKPATTQATTTAAPAQPAEPADGWQVDPWELRSFGDAVMRARAYLDAVQAKVDRMQGAELTPQLGTSPVGTQLAKKFDDRLNSVNGLRAMLVEAMKRMEDFVTSAENAARVYQDHEESTVDSFTDHHADPPRVKHG